jgi:hypothetical protein
MSTSNLISKSLGDVLTQSGNGEPDHTAPLGSIYSDKDSGKVWKNIDGSTSWEVLQTVAYGDAYVQDNTTTNTSITASVWTASGVNLTGGTMVGFSGDGTTQFLTLLDGYDGEYEVRLDATLSYVAGSTNHRAGISVNSGDPIDGRYSSTYLDSTYQTQHVGVQTTINLTGGTTLSIDLYNTTGDNVRLEHVQLFARRVG